MVSVKVYFNDEIRRFQFDAPKSGPIYSALVQKLHLMYSDFPLADVDLCWNDSDGDLVVFRSDDELKEAMRNINDGVFRIVVKSNKPKVSRRGCKGKTAASDVSGPIHAGVVCDGCELKQVVGIRYKCMVCPDYDLCECCLNDKVHDQHAFMRITKPDDKSWQGVWFPNGRRHGRPCGMPWGRFPMNPEDMKMAQEMFGRHAMRGPHGCHRRRHCDTNEKQEKKTEGTKGTEAKDETIPPNVAEQLQQASQFVQDIIGNVGQAAAQASQPEHLQEAGKFVKDLLGNFGIDVDFEVGPPKAAGNEKSAEASKTEEPKPAAPEVGKPVPVDKVAKPSVDVNDATENNTHDDKPAGWTVIDKEIPSAPEPETAAPVASLYPSTAGAEKASELDENVAKALHHMINMGFTNEGNWLGQLLVAKNANISAVLDALAPVRGQR